MSLVVKLACIPNSDMTNILWTNGPPLHFCVGSNMWCEVSRHDKNQEMKCVSLDSILAARCDMQRLRG